MFKTRCRHWIVHLFTYVTGRESIILDWFISLFYWKRRPFAITYICNSGLLPHTPPPSLYSTHSHPKTKSLYQSMTIIVNSLVIQNDRVLLHPNNYLFIICRYILFCTQTIKSKFKSYFLLHVCVCVVCRWVEEGVGVVNAIIEKKKQLIITLKMNYGFI